jgi:hypothetical protein
MMLTIIAFFEDQIFGNSDILLLDLMIINNLTPHFLTCRGEEQPVSIFRESHL